MADLKRRVVALRYRWKNQEFANDTHACLIFASRPNDNGGLHDQDFVYVLPISHSKPRSDQIGLKIPSGEKRNIGLDGETNWIYLSEWSIFSLPGDIDYMGRNQRSWYNDMSANYFSYVMKEFDIAVSAGKSVIVKQAR